MKNPKELFESIVKLSKEALSNDTVKEEVVLSEEVVEEEVVLAEENKEAVEENLLYLKNLLLRLFNNMLLYLKVNLTRLLLKSKKCTLRY